MARLSVATFLAALLAAASAYPSGDWESCPVPKTLYTMSNLVPNHIIAVPVGADGKVSAGTSIATGGNGGDYLQPDGVTPEPNDSLAAGDPIVVAGDVLYVVNAGSSSVSAFKINAQDSTKISLIAAPTALKGEFPVTIAVSEALDTVCVGTAGAKNGVECFHGASTGKLVPDGVGFRAFGNNATTPPLRNSDGVSDLFFSKDNTRLFAPVKGDTMKSFGYLSVFPVQNKKVGAKDTRSSPAGAQLLFQGLQVPGSSDKLFFSDAAFGAIAVQLDSAGKATTIGKGVSNPHVTALCWAEYSTVSQSVWVTSPISNSLLAFDVNNAKLLSQVNITNPNGGLSDIVVPGKYLYGLATGSTTDTKAGIAVVDISKGSAHPETVQFLTIGYGVNSISAGLAYYA